MILVTTADSVEEIERFLTYTLENCETFKASKLNKLSISFVVVSEIGGLLGLFLGCSLLSIVEVFCFLFSSTIRAIINRKPRQVKKVASAEEVLRNWLMKRDEKHKELFARVKKLEELYMKVEEIDLDGP